jgi:5'-nucleotidase
VDIIDVIQAVRPFDQYLVTTELTGADVLKIIEDNVREPVTDIIEDRLVQVSGMHYSFDRSKPKDGRVVSSDLDLQRTYKVVLEGQVPERETMYLAGNFGKLTYLTTDIPFSAALYAYTVARKQIVGPLEGRVREVTGK